MKKFVIVLIIALMLAACGSANEEPAPETEATAEQPAAEEPTDAPAATTEPEEEEVTEEAPTDTPTDTPPTDIPEPTAPPEPTTTDLPPTEPPVSSAGWPYNVSALPEGDPENGEELYNVTYGCMACHGDITVEGSNAVGPWHGNLAEIAETRIDGYTGADYTYESVLLPSAFIVADCPTGPCAGPVSIMPATFGDQMTPQEMADILAFMLGTTTFDSNVDVIYPEP